MASLIRAVESSPQRILREARGRSRVMPSLPDLEAAVRTVADTAAARRAEWDALDAATGDGDFGSTLHRGFAAVVEGWDALDRESERAFLADVSRVLAAAMG